IPPCVRAIFPTGHAALDRELSRLLAMIECDDSALRERVAAQLTRNSGPAEDIHYLTVLARMRGSLPARLTEKTAEALLALDRKAMQRHLQRERHWTLRLTELYTELARQDPSLHAALLHHEDFGRPDHALFALAAGFARAQAAEVFLRRAEE